MKGEEREGLIVAAFRRLRVKPLCYESNRIIVLWEASRKFEGGVTYISPLLSGVFFLNRLGKGIELVSPISRA